MGQSPQFVKRAARKQSGRVVVRRPYTVAGAAKHLRCSKKTIYRLLQRGVLRSSSVTRHKRIPAEDVERLVAETC